jgi:hypothetical protein
MLSLYGSAQVSFWAWCRLRALLHARPYWPGWMQPCWCCLAHWPARACTLYSFMWNISGTIPGNTPNLVRRIGLARGSFGWGILLSMYRGCERLGTRSGRRPAGTSGAAAGNCCLAGFVGRGTDYALPASWSGVISGQFPVPLIGALSLLCYYAWLEIRLSRPLPAGRRAGLIGLGLAVTCSGSRSCGH